MKQAKAKQEDHDYMLYFLFVAVVAWGNGWVFENLDPPEWVRLVLIYLPILPLVLPVRAIFRSLRVLDEMQMRMQLEAITFAFVGTLVVTLGHGMLRQAGFLEGWAWEWYGIWAMMLGFWLAGNLVAARKYLD